jgi:3-oxoacyl-[acyl-carrier protein] reductase
LSPYEHPRGPDPRAVIVTGGASGFGEAIARRFARTGARVAVADINEAGAQRVAADLDGALAVPTDVSVPDQIQALIEQAAATFGRIDVLVNNAGAGHRSGPVDGIDVEVFDAQYALNLRSVFLGVKYAVPYMPDGSVIVNTASVGGRRPRPFAAVYNSTKGGILSLTRSLALELAPRIRVCAVSPTGAQTGFLMPALGISRLTGDALKGVVDGIPMARLAEPEDVASAVEYLASPDAAYLTGVCLDVDGGRSVQ